MLASKAGQIQRQPAADGLDATFLGGIVTRSARVDDPSVFTQGFGRAVRVSRVSKDVGGERWSLLSRPNGGDAKVGRSVLQAPRR